MKILLTIYLIFLVLLTACDSENPAITETGNGKVLVTSNVEAGEIFVGDEFTGLHTPDTLELLAVKHKIKVRKTKHFSEEREISIKKNEISFEHFELIENKIKKNILIENFTEYDCTPCYSNSQINELKNSYGEQIQIINFPVDYGDSDLFSNIRQFVDLRLELYNNLFLPYFVLDGQVSENLVSEFDERILEETKFEITIADTIIQGGILVLSIFLDVYDLDGLEFENLVLHNLITENKVKLSVLENDTKVDYLFRSFFGSANGISLAGISEKGRARFAVSEILNPTWQKEELKIISFVQNENSKEIFQTGSSTLSLQ